MPPDGAVLESVRSRRRPRHTGASGSLFARTQRLVAASLLLAGSPWLCACGTKIKRYECTVLTRESPVDARKIWQCNREIIVHAIAQHGFTLREFERAASFFERLTGIPAHTRSTAFGPLPAPGLKDDLVAWDHWFETHGDRLYWDPEARAVETRPEDGT